MWRGMILTGSLRQLQVKKHYTTQLVLHTKLSNELDDDENLSSEEKTCFTRVVTNDIHNFLHKKKRRRAHLVSSLDILRYRKKTENKVVRFSF